MLHDCWEIQHLILCLDRQRICCAQRKALCSILEPQPPLNLLPGSPEGIGVVKGRINVPDVHLGFSWLPCPLLNKESLRRCSPAIAKLVGGFKLINFIKMRPYVYSLMLLRPVGMNTFSTFLQKDRLQISPAFGAPSKSELCYSPYLIKHFKPVLHLLISCK